MWIQVNIWGSIKLCFNIAKVFSGEVIKYRG